MQPPALKHEYLTSVANVLKHPIARRPADGPGPWRVVGFGDVDRTLPLMLVINTDGTVRHAFPPKHPLDIDLIKALQHNDEAWAKQHATVARPIIGLLQRPGGADRVNRRGLPDYVPAPRIGPSEREHLAATWFNTTLYPEHLEINDHGQIQLTPGSDDYDVLTENVADSVNMNAGASSPWVKDVPLEVIDRPKTSTERRGGMRVAGPLVFHEDTPADDHPTDEFEL